MDSIGMGRLWYAFFDRVEIHHEVVVWSEYMLGKGSLFVGVGGQVELGWRVARGGAMGWNVVAVNRTCPSREAITDPIEVDVDSNPALSFVV